jgi:hypothetical protein
MDEKRQKLITERRAQIPSKYRAIYDRAVKGKGLRAAVDAQCLECVYYKSDEVRNCTDLACPLWAVRPYRISRNSQNEDFSSAESENSGKGDNYAG